MYRGKLPRKGKNHGKDCSGSSKRKSSKENHYRGSKKRFEVTAFGRRAENDTDAKNYIQKDILELTREDLKGYDAVVDAFGAWTDETLPLHSKTTEHLADILSGTAVRLLVVGGAGSLYVNPEHTIQVADGENFPEAFGTGYGSSTFRA